MAFKKKRREQPVAKAPEVAAPAWSVSEPVLSWLHIGVGIKRWLAVIALGVMLITLGLNHILTVDRIMYRLSTMNRTHVTLVTLGMVCLVTGVVFLIRSLAAALAPERKDYLGNLLYRNRLKQRGPRVVVIGGGTGLSTLLKGMKVYTTNLTAVVTVSDDGGSSGRLVRDFEVLPPGDIRNCLVALARSEDLIASLFQYRFDKGGDLVGHSFGNLLIAALTEITGDFLQAIEEVSKVLAITGEVLPSTCEKVMLKASFTDGQTIRGETRISGYGRHIQEISLEPPSVSPPPQVLERIASADCIVIGPGSLFTSLIPNLLVHDICRAINASSAQVVLVSNIMTQPGETDGYNVSDHVRAIFKHSSLTRIDSVVYNDSPISPARLKRYASRGSAPVLLDEDCAELPCRMVSTDLVTDDGLIRHDPQRLSLKIMELIEEKMVKKVRILSRGMLDMRSSASPGHEPA